MLQVEFVDFITKGNSLSGIQLNDKLGKVIEVHGTPIEKIGNDNFGFLQFARGVRYGYVDNEIVELALLFREDDQHSFRFYNNLNEEIEISGLTLAHEFIYMLKTIDVNWRCVNEKELDTLTIEINKLTYVFIDLYSGYLKKVFISRK